VSSILAGADVAGSYRDAMESVFSSAVAGKAWLATGAIVLAIVQVLTAARMWGKLSGFIRLPTPTVQRIHRWSGRLALLLTLPVVFHCTTILGFQTGDARVAVHSIMGSFLYGIFAAKMVVVRDHSFPGWVLPVAGGALFAGLATLWLTSSFWYFTEVRFGF